MTKAKAKNAPGEVGDNANASDEERDRDNENAGGNEKPSEPLRALSDFRALVAHEELALSPEGAVLLLAYVTEREHAHGDQKETAYPNDVVAFAVGLRKTQPMVWSAIVRTDYMGLARALSICALPPVDARVLQRACSELGTVKASA